MSDRLQRLLEAVEDEFRALGGEDPRIAFVSLGAFYMGLAMQGLPSGRPRKSARPKRRRHLKLAKVIEFPAGMHQVVQLAPAPVCRSCGKPIRKPGRFPGPIPRRCKRCR